MHILNVREHLSTENVCSSLNQSASGGLIGFHDEHAGPQGSTSIRSVSARREALEIEATPATPPAASEAISLPLVQTCAHRANQRRCKHEACCKPQRAPATSSARPLAAAGPSCIGRPATPDGSVNDFTPRNLGVKHDAGRTRWRASAGWQRRANFHRRNRAFSAS